MVKNHLSSSVPLRRILRQDIGILVFDRCSLGVSTAKRFEMSVIVGLLCSFDSNAFIVDKSQSTTTFLSSDLATMSPLHSSVPEPTAMHS